MNHHEFDGLELSAVRTLVTLRSCCDASLSEQEQHKEILEVSAICPSELSLYQEKSSRKAAVYSRSTSSETLQDLTSSDSLSFDWPSFSDGVDPRGLQCKKELAPPTDTSLTSAQHEGPSSNQLSASGMTHLPGKKASPSTDQFGKEKAASQHHLQDRQWEKFQAIIKRLYIDEEKSLTITRQLMKDDYGFVASEMAYKVRFQEWNWEKRLRKPPTDLLLKEEEQRKAQGKSTTFTYLGSTISRPKMNRFRKRTATVDTKTYSQLITKTLCGLPYHTPSPGRYHHVLGHHTCSSRTAVMDDDFAAWLGLIPDSKYDDTIHRLEQSIIRLTGLPNANKISLRDFELYESASREINAAAQECVMKCQSSYGMSFAIKFFNDPLLLSKRRVHDGRSFAWADYEFVTLPILYCKALCLAAVRRYDESEVLVDKLLERHRRCVENKSTQYFRKIIPMIVLLSKTYLARGKFYVLKKLVSGTLSETRSFQGLEHETWTLHQILYAAMMFELHPKGVTDVPFSVDRLEKHILTDLLACTAATNMPGNLRHNVFILGALELLRHRCWHLHGAAARDLSAIIHQEHAFLETTWAHASEDTDIHMTLAAAAGLVESSEALQNDGQAQFWQTWLDQMFPAGDWKHRLAAPAVPVYKTLERYVEEEWPFVPLIRGSGSEVSPPYESSAPLLY
ncbi:hypothetical protein MMC11_007348 [Xylographa trunciseda]|nr:hypothetical protein [Xylographa trunciseda]